MSGLGDIQPWSRAEIARLAADDIQDGWYVNLGIGLPTDVANFIPSGREVILHSENGILGMDKLAGPSELDRWLVNAGKQHVTIRKGGSFFHQADSFAMIRGGHVDLAILGAYEVSETGDLANWASDTAVAPAVGGAMDLAAGARWVWVTMEHLNKQGASRVVRKCGFPLTATGVVSRIYTSLAVLHVTPQGLMAKTLAPGLDIERLRGLSDATILDRET